MIWLLIFSAYHGGEVIILGAFSKKELAEEQLSKIPLDFDPYGEYRIDEMILDSYEWKYGDSP